MDSAEWDAAYAEGEIPTPIDPYLVEVVSGLPPGDALDLGCGAGQNSIWLAEQGWTVTGVDFAPTAVAQAQAAAQAAEVAVDFQVGDLATWEPNGVFDLVINIYAQPVRGPVRSHGLATAARAVKQGGMILMVEFDQSAGLWSDDELVTLEEVTEHLGGFEILRAGVEVTKHAHGHEQSEHPVVVVVARKPAS